MRLEAIEQTQSPAGKLRLRFEDGQTLLVLPSVVAKHGLIPGMSLPEAALDVLRDDAALASTKERAVRILAGDAQIEAFLRRWSEIEAEFRRPLF